MKTTHVWNISDKLISRMKAFGKKTKNLWTLKRWQYSRELLGPLRRALQRVHLRTGMPKIALHLSFICNNGTTQSTWLEAWKHVATAWHQVLLLTARRWGYGLTWQYMTVADGLLILGRIQHWNISNYYLHMSVTKLIMRMMGEKVMK